MNKIFNTTFELSLRTLLILNFSAQETLSVEKIVTLDFMVIYGKDFGFSSYNLHGDNNYRFSEYTTKRSLIQDSIKLLGIRNLIYVKFTENGFHYQISEIGINYCTKLNNQYITEYYDILSTVITKTKNYTDRELLALLNTHSINSIQGGIN